MTVMLVMANHWLEKKKKPLGPSLFYSLHSVSEAVEAGRNGQQTPHAD